jgi:hypothetical protein
MINIKIKARLFIIVFILLSVNSFLNATYLMYIEFNDNHDNDTVVRCIDDYYFENDGLVYTKSLDGKKYRFYYDDMEHFEFKEGYALNDDDNCVRVSTISSDYTLDSTIDKTFVNYALLGIPSDIFNVLMAFSGLFISAIFLYGLVRFI